MKRVSVIILVSMLCQIFIFQKTTASDFKIVKKQGDITLYERWIKGANGESVRELKAGFVIQSNATEIIELLKNQLQGIQWNSHASVYKIADTRNTHQWINYIRYDMPAIMNDQECCLQFMSSYDNAGVCKISFSSTYSPLFPATPGIKRITGVKGEWILEPCAGNNLKVTYFISSDRNKNIPRFLSDPIVRDNLFKTMENFKKQLEK